MSKAVGFQGEYGNVHAQSCLDALNQGSSGGYIMRHREIGGDCGIFNAWEIRRRGVTTADVLTMFKNCFDIDYSFHQSVIAYIDNSWTLSLVFVYATDSERKVLNQWDKARQKRRKKQVAEAEARKAAKQTEPLLLSAPAIRLPGPAKLLK